MSHGSAGAEAAEAEEAAELEERVKARGERGSGRKQLEDKHKREARRYRSDEVRAGLTELSRPGTLIVADNVVREGRILDPSPDDTMATGIREFLDVAGAEPRLDGTAVQTVGAKGHDGFAFLVVDRP